MAKDTAKKSSGSSRRKLLDAARQHRDALKGAGLSMTVLDRFETSLKGLENKTGEPNVAAQTLIKDIQREAAEVQAAIRKEFSGNTSFLAVFKAGEPVPQEPRAVLALGRLIAKEAPDYAQNLIKYAINAASVNHLTSLCDQLEKELGGANPEADATDLEGQILEVARRAFEGKPELSQFQK